MAGVFNRVENRSNPQIELWIKPKDHAGDHTDSERDCEAGSIHAGSFSRRATKLKGGPPLFQLSSRQASLAPTTGAPASDQPVRQSTDDSRCGRKLQ